MAKVPSHQHSTETAMPKSAKDDARKTRFVVQAFDEIQGVLQCVISELASGTIIVFVVVVAALPYVLL